jgi:hypothetical protein
LEFFGSKSKTLPQRRRGRGVFCVIPAFAGMTCSKKFDVFLCASAVKAFSFSSFIFYELAERSSNSVSG